MVDIIHDNTEFINNKKPIIDKEIEEYLDEKLIILMPVNYDETLNYFDTSSFDKVIEKVMEVNENVVFVTKATVFIGDAEETKIKYKFNNILFSPSFLLEKEELYTIIFIRQKLLWKQTIT